MGAVACGEYRSRRPELSALYGAFREGWPQVESEASFRGGLPKRVNEEVQRYLRCGILRYGFGQLKCEDCHESVLVAFSCKSRGWCPGCGTKAFVGDGEPLRSGVARAWLPAMDLVAAARAKAGG